jgi:hypothetical protein
MKLRRQNLVGVAVERHKGTYMIMPSRVTVTRVLLALKLKGYNPTSDGRSH